MRQVRQVWNINFLGLVGVSLLTTLGGAEEASPEPAFQTVQNGAQESGLTADKSPKGLRPAWFGLLTAPLADVCVLEQAAARDFVIASVLAEQAADAQNESRTQLSDVYGTAGRLYYRYELPESVEACYRNASQLRATAFRWNYLLVKFLESRSQSEQGIAQYERTQDGMGGLVKLGKAYLQANQVVFRRAVEPQDQSEAAHAGNGQTAVVQARYTDALQHLETAFELMPAANPLCCPLAMTYRLLKDEEQAKTHIEPQGTGEAKVAIWFIAEIENLFGAARRPLVRHKLGFETQRYWEDEAFDAVIQADRRAWFQ